MFRREKYEELKRENYRLKAELNMIKEEFQLARIDHQILMVKMHGRKIIEIQMDPEVYSNFCEVVKQNYSLSLTPITYKGIPIKEVNNIRNWYIKIK